MQFEIWLGPSLLKYSNKLTLTLFVFIKFWVHRSMLERYLLHNQNTDVIDWSNIDTFTFFSHPHKLLGDERKKVPISNTIIMLQHSWCLNSSRMSLIFSIQIQSFQEGAKKESHPPSNSIPLFISESCKAQAKMLELQCNEMMKLYM